MFSQTFVPLGLSCAPWHRGAQGRAHSRAHSRAHPGRSVSILTPTPSTQTHAAGPMNMEKNVCNMCSIVLHYCQVNLERHFPAHRDALARPPPPQKRARPMEAEGCVANNIIVSCSTTLSPPDTHRLLLKSLQPNL